MALSSLVPSLSHSLARALSLSLLLACGKSSSTKEPASGKGAASAGAIAASDAALAMDPIAMDLWTRAKEDTANDGAGGDLARLASHEGVTGLMTHAGDPAWRMTAIHALAYVDGFDQLPWLANVARASAAPESETEAAAALDAIVDMAARPRRAVDPEDAAELREGAASLLVLAKDEKAPRARRVVAIRALRMLVDRGALAADEIPTSLDAH